MSPVVSPTASVNTAQYSCLSAASKHCGSSGAAAFKSVRPQPWGEVHSKFTQFLGNSFSLVTQHWVTLWDKGQLVLPQSTIVPHPPPKFQVFFKPLNASWRCRASSESWLHAEQPVLFFPRVSHRANQQELGLVCARSGTLGSCIAGMTRLLSKGMRLPSDV